MADLAEVAFVGDEVEAAMIQALLEQHGIPSIHEQVGPSGRQLANPVLTPGGSRRVMVHAHRVEEARAALAEALEEGEQEAPEPVNARYLEEDQGYGGPRNYGLIGALVRTCAVGFGAMALFAAIWMLFRVL
jgi:Putative prokaryotic signal transducing protein